MTSLPALSADPRRARARRTRGTRRAALGLAALAAVGLASGCAVDNTPTAYNDQVQSNFIATCTGTAPVQASTTTKLATPNECQCAYNVFTAQVPYNGDDRGRVAGYPGDAPTFQDLEKELHTDPSKYSTLPSAVQNSINACKPAPQGPVAPGTTATPGSTAPAGTGTTTPS